MSQLSQNIDISNSLILNSIKPGFTQPHFGVHEKPKSFENRANDMLFWITGINWYMSRLTIPKIPFRSLTMIIQNYPFHSRLTFWGMLTQKQDFIALRQFNLTHTFPLTEATWTTFGQKSQGSPNLTKTLSIDKNNINHFEPKEPCQNSPHCHQVGIPYNQGS